MNATSTYRWTDVPWLTATVAIYALLAKLVLTFYSTNGMVSVFWPGAGVSLAVLLLGGKKYWPGIYIGALLGGLWAGQAPLEAALISVGSVLEALLGAWLLSRHSDFNVSLRSARDFFRLCYLAAALSPGICAVIGISTLLSLQRIPANNAVHEFALWWMGDTLGIVIIAPLILVWRKLPPQQLWKLPEALLLFGITFLIGQIIFLDWFSEIFNSINRGFWVYPVICWAAVRFGLHGVLLILLLMTVQAIMGTALGTGTYSHILVSTQLINFWSHTLILTIIGIALAIIFSERERIAAEQQSSEARYRSLFKNMPDGMSQCRMIFQDGKPVDYEFIAVNPAFETVSDLKDVVGRKISEIIPGYAQDNQISLETFGNVVMTGEPVRWEHYFAARGRWFSFTAYRSAPEEFICLTENITERKQAEDELHKLSQAVAQSPVSIVITDLDARIQYVNPAFTLVSGYTAAEAMCQNPRLLKSSRTPQETYQALWAALKAGKVWRGEFINRRKDGTEFFEDATIAPLRQADGQITHYVGVKTDITGFKRAMAELRASEDRFLLAKTAAGLGLYDHDLVHGTIEWDARAREFWGIGPDEPVNFATFTAGIHPDDRRTTQIAVDQAYDPAGSGRYFAEYRVVSRADGRVRHIMASGQVFFDNGKAVRSIGILRDISAEKRLAKADQERRSEMEGLINQQVAAQTAAAIAHELNQPLVAVSAYSEAALRMLRGGKQDPEKLLHALDGAMTQAQRAGRTLHELLDFLHQGEVLLGPVDINDVVLSALAIAEESGYSGFHTVIELEPGLPPVLANRLQLQKVMVNLLYNGVEAMRSARKPAAALTITVRTMKERNLAQVTVQDSGPGLDEETVHRIFDPFFTTKSEGIGLGLAISRSLIEANGGQLWADIKAGPGATFHFVLPFAP